MLSFYINGYVYTRRVCEEYKVTDTEVYSKWIPYEGIVVETRIIPTDSGHLREHTIVSDRDCDAYDCGFAVQIDVDGEKLSQNKNSARVENYYAFCEVVSEDNIGEGVVINADPNTNLLYPMTRIPAVCYHIKQGKTVIKTKVIAEFSKK